LPTEPGVLAFTRGGGFVCVVNCSSRVVSAPVDGELLLASHHEGGDKVPPNSAAWYLLWPSAESVGEAACTSAGLQTTRWRKE
jgi:alpha-glucosidase